MSSTQFKLIQTGPGALTRRVTFAEQPTWFSLATRIETLYGIPIQDVGVSYMDSDGDEITLSTHEELRDYYATVPRIHNIAIKFFVKNLGALRSQQRQQQEQPQQPQKPRQPSPDLFDLDEDWQGLNIPFQAIFRDADTAPPPPPKSPSHGFVESVDTSSTAEPIAVTDIRSGTVSPAIVIISDDKGKGREELLPPVEEVDDDASSVVSVIHSDMPVKEPVHVYEFESDNGFVGTLRRYNAVARSMSRSRSRSISRSPSPSRSRSPSRRSRSMSRVHIRKQPVMSPGYRGPSISRSRTRSPRPGIVVCGPRTPSPSRSPSRQFGSRGPISSKPPYMGPGRSISRSPTQCTVVVSGGRSRSRTPPMTIDIQRRSRSRSPAGHVYSSVEPSMRIFGPGFRSRSPPISRAPPPRIGIQISRPRSPSGLFGPVADPLSPVMAPVPDPPLPTQDSAPPQTPSTAGSSASLSNDIAGLLNALTGAFAAHPELSEGLKNIVRNARQGAYWTTEHDTMVNDARRAVDQARDDAAHAAQQAQEEAGRKVAEALGGVFRALGGLVGVNAPAQSSQNDEPQEQRNDDRTVTPEPRDRPNAPPRTTSPDPNPYPEMGIPAWKPFPPPFPPPPGPPPPGPPPQRRSRSPGPRPPRRSPSPDFYPYPPPPGRHSPPPGHSYHPGPPPPRPPPPPGHHFAGPPPPGPPQPLLGHHHRPGPPPHLGRYFGSVGPFPPPMFSPMPWEPPAHGLRRSSTMPSRFGRFGTDFHGGPPPPPPPPPPPGGHLSSAQRKAQLEEAKNYYKAKKDEWRREKEQRRLEKERREKERTERMKHRERLNMPLHQAVVYSSDDEERPILQGASSSGQPSRPQPMPPMTAPEDIFNAWTRLGRPRNSPVAVVDSVNRDTQKQKLMKRLADMGFTSRTHPQLEGLVAKHTRKNTEMGKDGEDAILASLLEELFVSPVGESSGSRPADRPSIPGSWKI